LDKDGSDDISIDEFVNAFYMDWDELRRKK
jgi:hypothetical protein